MPKVQNALLWAGRGPTMSRGRKPSLVPTVQWSIMIPIDLAFQIEAQLMDPVTQKAAYSARSKLIQSLLYNWLKEQGVKPIIPSNVICPDCKRPKATSENDVMAGACPKWHLPDNEEAKANCMRRSQSELSLENPPTSTALSA